MEEFKKYFLEQGFSDRAPRSHHFTFEMSYKHIEFMINPTITHKSNTTQSVDFSEYRIESELMNTKTDKYIRTR